MTSSPLPQISMGQKLTKITEIGGTNSGERVW